MKGKKREINSAGSLKVNVSVVSGRLEEEEEEVDDVDENDAVGVSRCEDDEEEEARFRVSAEPVDCVRGVILSRMSCTRSLRCMP